MSLNRRNFLQAGIGIGIGTAGSGVCHLRQAAQVTAAVHDTDVPLSEYERILATTNLFNSLGHPRSWSVVRQGFFPISPDRVLILKPAHLDGLAHRWRDEQVRIRERMQEDASEDMCRKHAAEDCGSAEQLGMILWLTNELTRF